MARCWLGLGLLAASLASAQQTPPALTVSTDTLPAASLRERYEFQLQAQGGLPPYRWAVKQGDLPPGLALSETGALTGTPTKAGEFPVVVIVTDSSSPGYQRTQAFIFRVTVPLMAEWGRPPKVVGPRVEGSIKVSNQENHDFDLTLIALAVNEIGRATAIGYQHFTLKSGTMSFEIPFGERLPRGAYDIHVDVVAEVPETNTIHRTRLVSSGKMQVAQGP